ncbi:MAG: ATP-binding protein [Bacteroidales bacterium]|nr:ATP-binding protein [Bacteroidales bacterium]
MSIRRKIKGHLRFSGAAALAVAVLVIVLSFFLSSNNIRLPFRNSSARAGKIISLKLDYLDSCIDRILTCGETNISGFQDDMVLYTYFGDSLVRWQNEFPLLGDELIPHFDGYLTHLEFGLSSPISHLGEDYVLTQFGDEWYLARKESDISGYTVVGGLRVASGGKAAGYLRLGEQAGISTLMEGIGEPVEYKGRPLFVISNSTGGIFGSRVSGMLFSPLLFSSGEILDSFGAFICVCCLVFLLVLGLYLNRLRLFNHILGNRKALSRWGFILVVFIIALGAWSLWSVWNLLSNSSIALEPQWYSGGFLLTLLAIVFSTLQIGGVLLLAKMLESVTASLKGVPANHKILTYKGITILSLAVSVLFFAMSLYEHSIEESSRTRIWANRLSVERDLMTELHLLGIENDISSDPRIPYFLQNSSDISSITSGIQESYFQKEAASYTVSVDVVSTGDRNAARILSEKFFSGTLIAPGSNFVAKRLQGRISYTGMFTYSAGDASTTYFLINLDSKGQRQSRSSSSVYSSFDSSEPTEIYIPRIYAYAKYSDGKLINYRGSYAYPIIIDDFHQSIIDGGKSFFTKNRYIHFIYAVDDEQVVILSRPLRSSLMLLSGYLSLFLVVLFVMLVFLWTGGGFKRPGPSQVKGFRRRINATVIMSVVVVLGCLSTVSVKFVLDKSLADRMELMSMGVSSVESLIENKCRDYQSSREIETADFLSFLRNAGNDANTDITLYRTSGKAFLSTASDAFSSPFVSMRMGDMAFDSICRQRQRFFVESRKVRGVHFYNLYAPVLNREGTMLAIVCVPFGNSRRDVMIEVVPHAILLFTISLFLLLIVFNVIRRFTDRLFEPLSEVSAKMKNASGGLEHIKYEPRDEVSLLVDSYNRMVDDLKESSIKLAQSERDKAWSAMARQVAHEIKNPLTPIKLELQRLVYLKQKGDPSWEKKFSEIAAIILEHVDVLTETADEFSSFAKLYTQEPVEINLDKMLQDQVTFFSGRQDIEIEYMGYRDAVIYGPKPQLIRVFVNLMTNAVQALTISGTTGGKVLVQLRNSIREGYYEVLVEDNGPGVAPENQDKLFQPNFTTKSAGAGLGLAMCKGIVEKCSGTIRYEKSFTLGGAAFVVQLPKQSYS